MFDTVCDRFVAQLTEAYVARQPRVLFEGLGTTVDLCTMRYHVPGGAATAGAGAGGGGAGGGLAVGFAVRGRMHADAEPLPELPQRAVAGAAAGVGAAMAWGEMQGVRG